MIYKLRINKEITLKQLNRIAIYEGMDVIIDNGKAYVTVEVNNVIDFIEEQR